MRPGTTRRGFMRETSMTAALSSISDVRNGRVSRRRNRLPVRDVRHPVPGISQAAGPLRDLRRRAPVRRARWPGVDDA